LPALAQAHSDAEMLRLWLGRCRSRHTRRAYEGDWQAFAAFTGGKPLRSVTVGDMQDFAASLERLSAATQSRRLSGIRSLISYGMRLGYLAFDVGAPVQLPVQHDRLTERIMTEENVLRLLGMVRKPRDAALLRLIYSAGLRVSEACGLCWRDLTPRDDAGQINVLGKGGKSRVILLPPAIWRRLLALRGRGGPDDPVFCSRFGGAIQPRWVERIVKEAARRARLPAAISPHYLRHAHASHALDRGCPVHVVQTTLGHASLTTTTRYTHVRPGDSSARYLAG
jgi:integrase/recombinase XerD